MLDSVDNGLIFLVRILFELYIIAIMLRVILQWAGVHYFNPIAQLVVKLTNPVLKPLRRIIPSWHGIDFAALILLLALELIKLLLIIWLQVGSLPNIIGLMVWGFADLLNILLNFYFWAILIAVVISLLGQAQFSSVAEVLHLITEPLLRPFRRAIPPIAGFDLSPLPVIIILKIIDIIFVNMLISVGIGLANL